jgi:hypothetical protein
MGLKVCRIDTESAMFTSKLELVEIFKKWKSVFNHWPEKAYLLNVWHKIFISSAVFGFEIFSAVSEI